MFFSSSLSRARVPARRRKRGRTRVREKRGERARPPLPCRPEFGPRRRFLRSAAHESGTLSRPSLRPTSVDRRGSFPTRLPAAPVFHFRCYMSLPVYIASPYLTRAPTQVVWAHDRTSIPSSASVSSLCDPPFDDDALRSASASSRTLPRMVNDNLARLHVTWRAERPKEDAIEPADVPRAYEVCAQLDRAGCRGRGSPLWQPTCVKETMRTTTSGGRRQRVFARVLRSCSVTNVVPVLASSL
jgi:hypothetical protein